MERKIIVSSLIRSIGYDPEKQILYVEFLRNQKQDVRPIYQYANVTQAKYDALMGIEKGPDENHSIGSHFLRMIKPNHPCTKIEEKNESKTQSETTPPSTAA